MRFQFETTSEVYQLDGPHYMGGFRHIWHTLKMQGIGVPRSSVEDLLKELDLDGTEKRVEGPTGKWAK